MTHHQALLLMCRHAFLIHRGSISSTLFLLNKLYKYYFSFFSLLIRVVFCQLTNEVPKLFCPVMIYNFICFSAFITPKLNSHLIHLNDFFIRVRALWILLIMHILPPSRWGIALRFIYNDESSPYCQTFKSFK